MVVGESLHHRLERDDTGRRDHAGLPHATAPARALRARLADHTRRSAQHRSDRSTEPLREAEHDGVGRRDEVARCGAQRHRRVPNARPVDVHAQPARPRDPAQSRHLWSVDRRARQRHVRVLDHEHGRLWEVVSHALDRIAHAVGKIPQRVHLHATVSRRGGRLVAVDVRTVGTQHFGAGCREYPDRQLVRHRPRRDVEGGLLSEQRCRERLQPVDRGILAVDVVAHVGVGHRAAHLRGRCADRVGPEIDHAHDSRQPGFTGRISPSWITVAASAPSWRKMKPSARPRAPCADGLVW